MSEWRDIESAPKLYEHEKRYAAMRDAAPELYEAAEHAALTLNEMAAILRSVGRPGCADICKAEVTRIVLRLAKARGEPPRATDV